MIYQLQAPGDLAPFVDLFAGFPPRIFGMAIWLLFAVLALVYAFAVKESTARRVLGIPVPMLFAGAIYTGLFINTYDLVDEVSVNLEHSYNLFHYGKFSMSPERWIEGTVESLYYLLHVPFAWSQRSLIAANCAISYLIGLLHLPLAAYAIDPEAGPRKRTLLMCGFALSLPLAITFSSGFGNSMVSLLFLAAMASALNDKASRSLVLSGLLPLLRPDALLLSAVNAGVIVAAGWLTGKRLLSLRRHGVLLLLPAVSAGVYYSFYKATFGNWVPTPVFFKAVRAPMFAMTDKAGALRDILEYFGQGVHALALVCLLAVLLHFARRGQLIPGLAGDRRLLSLALYALSTMPLFLFYSVTQRTLTDFNSAAYSRYWVVFEISCQLLLLGVLSSLEWKPQTGAALKDLTPAPPLAAFLCLSVWCTLGNPALKFVQKPGRTDGAFAGAFTQRFLPAGFTLATTEMATFGLMVERPVIDLWGYTTPEIAHSGVCNGERVRTNGEYFLQVKPDVYWPYWFTKGPMMGEGQHGTFENVEEFLAGFHHTSKKGNRLGDMSQVLAEYDVAVIRTKWNDLAYLVRKSAIGDLVQSLEKRGFARSAQRPLDMERFHRKYDGQKLVTYPCR